MEIPIIIMRHDDDRQMCIMNERLVVCRVTTGNIQTFRIMTVEDERFAFLVAFK